jgi:hypothetical protein
MAARHGKNGRVIIGTTVLSSAKWTLNRTTDKVDVSGFGDPNKIYVIGKQDLTGSISGFWDDANDKLFDVADAGVAVNMYLYPDAVNAPTQYWWGSALLDSSIDVDSNGAVSFSGSFSAAAAWTRAGLP